MADNKKVGLIGLVAIVFTSMVGSSIYNLPQNMAASAGVAAIAIAWIISGFGMYFLASTFKTLSDSRSDITSGIYAYAKEGFGRYVGFNSAWGYWISGALGNVAFAILLNDAVGYFYPPLLEHGLEMIIFCTSVIWLMTFAVFRGVSFATKISAYSIFIVLTAILIIVGVLVYHFDWNLFTKNIWGTGYGIGGMPDQIKSTMLVTLWSFIGIEGAVVIAGRAKNSKDVGSATIIGLIIALVIYASVSLLSLGIMAQPELGKLATPSSAYLLQSVSGDWANEFVNIAVIISLLASWLAWTVLVAEVPYDAAKDGVLPKIFARDNKFKSPVASLIITAILMTIMIFIVILANDIYIACITIAGVMILPPYLLSCAYLWEASERNQILKEDHKKRYKAMTIGILGTLYCAWLLYSAGYNYLLMSTLFYAVGIPFYIKAHHESFKEGVAVFNKYERILAILFVIAAAASIFLMLEGNLKP